MNSSGLLALCWVCVSLATARAQQVPVVSLQEASIAGMPGVHSGALARYNDLWIYVGGRTNGLHGFLPPFAFPSPGINDMISIIDPVADQVWQRSTATLPLDIREAITSSNMQFWHEGHTLYMVGGYGWNDSAQNFITYPMLTAINLDTLIEWVMTGGSGGSTFKQLRDSGFAVAGAHLARIDPVYHLVFGHRFDGVYDVDDHSSFFEQAYTYAIRRFMIHDSAQDLAVSWLPPIIDSLNFRRRDYNLVPQVFSNGEYGFTAFSGVFRNDSLQPFTTTLDLTGDTVIHISTFSQRFSQYHSAVMPLWDSAANIMRTVFFGGMALYYPDSNNNVLKDTLIPFVRTISSVQRSPSQALSEVVLPAAMPGFLGTNAHFIPVAHVRHDGIIKLDDISGQTLVGYIIGGISSPGRNLSLTDPALSSASNRVFEVRVNPDPAHVPPEEIGIGLAVSPNPVSDFLSIESVCDDPAIVIIDRLGHHIPNPSHGPIDVRAWPSGLYIVIVHCDKGLSSLPVVVLH